MDVGSKARIATATAQRLLSWIFFFLFFLFNSSSGTKHRKGDILGVLFFVASPCVGMDCRVGWVGWMGLVSFLLTSTPWGRPSPPPSKSWPALSEILPFF